MPRNSPVRQEGQIHRDFWRHGNNTADVGATLQAGYLTEVVAMTAMYRFEIVEFLDRESAHPQIGSAAISTVMTRVATSAEPRTGSGKENVHGAAIFFRPQAI